MLKKEAECSPKRCYPSTSQYVVATEKHILDNGFRVNVKHLLSHALSSCCDVIRVVIL
jgi:hypothetical protein